MTQEELNLPHAFYEVWPQLLNVKQEEKVETESSFSDAVEIENAPIVVEQHLPATNTLESLRDKINSVTTKEELQDVAAQFNLNITKKEMTRAVTQDELLDLILVQMRDRISKRPDEMPTKDLLDIMSAFRNNIEKTQTYIDRVEESPSIQYNDNKQVTVNINNVHGLNRDSTENVIDALNDILKNLGSTSIQEVVDAVDTVDVSNDTEVKDND